MTQSEETADAGVGGTIERGDIDMSWLPAIPDSPGLSEFSPLVQPTRSRELETPPPLFIEDAASLPEAPFNLETADAAALIQELGRLRGLQLSEVFEDLEDTAGDQEREEGALGDQQVSRTWGSLESQAKIYG